MRRADMFGPDPSEVVSEPPVGPKQCLRCLRTYRLSQRFCLDDGERLSLPDPYHLVGRVFADRYRLDGLVGIGGMGAVYSAWHLAIDRRVAVKILQPNVAILDHGMLARFEREARTVGRLAHENIPDVFDAGRTADGIAFIAMEWLNGVTLEEELAETEFVSLERVAQLLGPITAALSAAHAAQIVHRDLKPSNVMIMRRADGTERVKVLDFGIAKALSESTSSSASAVVGTPAFASPEQLRGDMEVDARSDIYSLGVILYRMLAFRLPFEGSSIQEIVTRKLHDTPTPLRQLRGDVPEDIDALITRMLARDREDRPATAGEVNAVARR